MKYQYLISFSLLLLLMAGCSEEEVRPQESITGFANFDVGNYWVYDWYEIKPNGVTSLYNKSDSVYVAGDSIINGKTIYIIKGTFLEDENTILLFDSANSLFTYPDRSIHFTLSESIQETKNIGNDTDVLATATYSLDKTPDYVTVPAGRFQCINYQGTIEAETSNYPFGTRFNYNFYSEGIGLVALRTQFYNSPNDLEMRLVKYGSK